MLAATLIRYSLDCQLLMQNVTEICLHRLSPAAAEASSHLLDRISDETSKPHRSIFLMIWLMRHSSAVRLKRSSTQILSAMTSKCYMSLIHNDWVVPRRQPILLVSIRSARGRNSILSSSAHDRFAATMQCSLGPAESKVEQKTKIIMNLWRCFCEWEFIEQTSCALKM